MAIIERFTRPGLPVKEGTFAEPVSGWEFPGAEELRDALEEHRDAMERAIACVGRLEVEGHPSLEWVGTGFLVAPYRFLTAGYVARLFASGHGDASVELRTDMKVFFTAGASTGSRNEFRLPVTRVRFLHPYFDLALFELGPGTATPVDEDLEIGIPLGLQVAAEAPPLIEGRKVAVIGFAARDVRNDQDDQARIFGTPPEATMYLMPGELLELTINSGKPSIAHDCSTLGGAGGAPLVDLETGQVVGVHFAGMQGQSNWAIPGWLLAKDPRVRAAGIRFADDPEWLHLWTIADIAADRDELADVSLGAILSPNIAKPEADLGIPYFTQDELYRIRDLLTATRLARADRQDLLYVAMSDEFRGTLSSEGPPDARLITTLNNLNQTPRLISGELPMRTLLFNAVQNSKEYPQSEELREFLNRLPESG